MKCPKCNLVQADRKAECRKCGLIFANYRPPPTDPKLIIYPDEPSFTAKYRRYIVPAGMLCAVTLSIAFVGQGRKAVVEEPVAQATETAKVPARGEALSRMCVENLLQMGATEEEAQASCLADRKAQKRESQAAKGRESTLAFVPASAVDHLELLLDSKDEIANIPGSRERVELRLVLYDAEGRSVSSEGTLEIAVDPAEAVSSEIDIELHRSNFRLAKIGDEKRLLVFSQLPSLFVSPEKTDSDRIEFTATFNGEVSCSSTIRIQPPEEGVEPEAGESS